jgi:hypothetical protein
MVLNYIGRAAVGLFLFGIACLPNIGCSDYNPYAGKKIEEVVTEVNVPRKGQDFIDHNVDYAYEDLRGGRPTALNGAEIQSFRTTFNRRRGVCRDGAIAIAAMLQDDGFPALIFDVDWDTSGHSVFVWQDSGGNWGSAGINSTDYRHSDFPTLEKLAREIGRDAGEDWRSYSLYDLSHLDLVEGTNQGLVFKSPFRIKGRGRGDFDATVTDTGSSYEVRWQRTITNEATNNLEIQSTCQTYTVPDVFLDSRVVESFFPDKQDTLFYEWQVLQRSKSRLPTSTTSYSEFFQGQEKHNKTSQTWTTYSGSNKVFQVNQDTTERDSSGTLLCFKKWFEEHNPETEEMMIYQIGISADGDFIIDFIERLEKNPDGTTTTFTDHDADGNWDLIVTE